jgi:hypothetical protein
LRGSRLYPSNDLVFGYIAIQAPKPHENAPIIILQLPIFIHLLNFGIIKKSVRLPCFNQLIIIIKVVDQISIGTRFW